MQIKEGAIVDGAKLMPYAEGEACVARCLQGIASCYHNDCEPPTVEAELEILYAYQEDGDYSEGSSAFVAKWGDVFLAGWESCDTTGHGCQCSGSLQTFGSIVDALNLGLGHDDRDKLSLVEPKPSTRKVQTTNAWRLVNGRLEPA